MYQIWPVGPQFVYSLHCHVVFFSWNVIYEKVMVIPAEEKWSTLTLSLGRQIIWKQILCWYWGSKSRLARQVLCYLSHVPSSFYSHYFLGRVSLYAQTVLDGNPPVLSAEAGCRHASSHSDFIGWETGFHESFPRAGLQLWFPCSLPYE
jgi:hypothetical protein